MNTKKIGLIITVLITALMYSFQDGKQTTDQFTGRWEMQELYDNGKDVTSQHNPKMNRYAVFHEDGTFESGGDPYGKNTGHWTLEETDEGTLLYLDSDAGEGDDSYWLITIDGNTMTWKGTRSEFTERFVVNHKRAGAK